MARYNTMGVVTLTNRLQYRHLIIFFLALVIILFSISISGCTTSGLGSPSLFLIEFRYSAGEGNGLTGGAVINPYAHTAMDQLLYATDLVIRTGFFGICTSQSNGNTTSISTLTQQNNSTSMGWKCSTNSSIVALEIPSRLDPLNLVYLASNFKSNVGSSYLIIITICLSFAAMIILMAISSSQTRAFFLVAGLCATATFLALIAMVWQQTSVNVATSSIYNLSNTSIFARAGKPVGGLAWFSTVVLFCLCIGIVCMFQFERQMILENADILPVDSEGRYEDAATEALEQSNPREIEPKVRIMAPY